MADEPKQVIIPCCEHLCTKTMYFDQEQMRAGRGYIKVTGTGTYWCDKTSMPLGPDNQPGLPKTCQPGRSCYERSVE